MAKKAAKKSAPKRSSKASKTTTKKKAVKKTTPKKSTSKKGASKAASPKKKATKKKATKKKAPVKKRATASAEETGNIEVLVDRRGSANSDRRQDKDRRQEVVAAEVDRRVTSERRTKVARRRQIDPTTCERDYSNDEIEFMHALDEYKRRAGRMFPTCSEILEVVRDLGYRRLTPEEIALLGSQKAHSAEAAGDTSATPHDHSAPGEAAPTGPEPEVAGFRTDGNGGDGEPDFDPVFPASTTPASAPAMHSDISDLAFSDNLHSYLDS